MLTINDAACSWRVTRNKRVIGGDHPRTLNSRNSLAMAYHSTGRAAEAIPLLERTLADREHILGTDHPHTLNSRNNLAIAYHSAGRAAEAIAMFEAAIVDYERVLGSDHSSTRAVRDTVATLRQEAQ